MKTKLFTLLFLFLTISVFAQKKEVYLNDDLVQITASEFKKTKESRDFYDLQFELDTLIANVKVKRDKKGKIALPVLDSLRTHLSTISNTMIPNDHIIVINYHFGPDPCFSSGDKSVRRASYKRYLEKLNKIGNISQFFIYKSPQGTKDYGDQLSWIHDKFGTIEKTFLPLHYPCGSFILIDEEGNYYIRKGEYSPEFLINLLKDRKKTFAN